MRPAQSRVFEQIDESSRCKTADYRDNSGATCAVRAAEVTVLLSLEMMLVASFQSIVADEVRAAGATSTARRVGRICLQPLRISRLSHAIGLAGRRRRRRRIARRAVSKMQFGFY